MKCDSYSLYHTYIFYKFAFAAKDIQFMTYTIYKFSGLLKYIKSDAIRKI